MWDVSEFRPGIPLEQGMTQVFEVMEREGRIPDSDELTWEDRIIEQQMMGVGEKERMEYAPVMDMLESLGITMMGGIFAMPLDHGRDPIEVAKKLLGGLPVGITHFLFHPSMDTPELRALAPDWPVRVANYNAFMSDELKKFLESEDIKVIGYRAIRNAMRSS